VTTGGEHDAPLKRDLFGAVWRRRVNCDAGELECVERDTTVARRGVRWLARRLAAREKSTDGYSAAERLCKHRYIGQSAESGGGKEFARAPHAGLYLIGYHQRPVFIAGRADRFEIFRSNWQEPALAYYRLYHNRGGTATHRFFQSL